MRPSNECLAKRLEYLCRFEGRPDEALIRLIKWHSLVLDFRESGTEAVQRIVDEEPEFCLWWVTHYIPEADGQSRD